MLDAAQTLQLTFRTVNHVRFFTAVVSKNCVAMDFFIVPTRTFGVLYYFFVIGHDRRKILHSM